MDESRDHPLEAWWPLLDHSAGQEKEQIRPLLARRLKLANGGIIACNCSELFIGGRNKGDHHKVTFTVASNSY